MLHANQNLHSISTICQRGPQNQMLMQRALNLGFYHEAKQCWQFDRSLIAVLHKTVHFDFVEQISQGKTLLVGEGNLSFALSLIQLPQIFSSRIFATTLEARDELSQDTSHNAQLLQAKGVTVLHGIDATNLRNSLGSWLFDNIVFQFPHVGARGSVEGRNPNFILIRDFLTSAYSQLAAGGQVLISAANTPHYRGAFQFEKAAEIAGFQPPQVYAFSPSQFPGYEHTMTHQTGSALENHDTFSTWVFRI